MAGDEGFGLRYKYSLTSAHFRVYTFYMKNITLSAQEDVIEKARAAASRKHRTLNDMFREWLDGVGRNQDQGNNNDAVLAALWEKNSYLRVGKKLTRDEINER